VDLVVNVTNSGGSTLVLQPASVSNLTLPAGNIPFGHQLAPGQSVAFLVRLNTSQSGARTGTLSIPSNDSDENPFNITLDWVVSPPPQPTLNITGGSATEGGQIRFTVQPTFLPPGTVSFSYRTIQGTALAGQDYSAFSGSRSFTGTSPVHIDVPLSEDQIVEPHESFILEIYDIQGAHPGTTQATGTIHDNDTARFTIEDVVVDEEDGVAELTITSDHELSSSIALDLLFTDGTAIGNLLDYDSEPQQVTFPADSLDPYTVMVPVEIVDDGLVEADETFSVAMAISSDTPAGTRNIDVSDTATVTIRNNDTAPTATIVIDDGTAQRSMIRSVTVNFDRAITYTDNAFQLTRNGQSVAVIADVAPGILTQQITLTFPGTVGGSLADGDYVLTVVGDQVTDQYGNSLDGNQDDLPGGNQTIEFFRFFGSHDGSRTIGAASYLQFIRTYRRSEGDPRFESFFDFDSDGVVGAQDFLEFRRRYRRTL
jgi:hypothetical protein